GYPSVTSRPGGRDRKGSAHMTTNRPAIPGIGFCPVARASAQRGDTVPTGHLPRCPVCIRRARMLEATIAAWPAIDHGAAQSMIEAMTEWFGDHHDHSG